MYGEIRSDHYDDIEGVVCIDAWKTSDGDEAGTVIAKVDVAARKVVYLDPAARYDPYAQEVIQDILQAVKNGCYDEDIQRLKTRRQEEAT